MPYLYSLFLGCAALLSFGSELVAAHGHVSQLVINGKTYKGPGPSDTPFDSVIRQINSPSPVKDLTSSDLTCGRSAKLATQVANVTAGSKIEIHWLSGENTNWPHNTGPLMTYLAACSNNDCTTDKATSAKWFKIDEAGKNPSTGLWVQNDLYEGKPYTLTIPSNIAAGSYLMRHEIIALHLAETQGGAEFYPSCSQLQISGGSAGAKTLATEVPSSDTVSLPGAYSPTDPGILVPHIYDTGFKYTFPGPDVPSAFVSNGDGGDGSNATSSISGSSVTPAPTTMQTTTIPESSVTPKTTSSPPNLPNEYGNPSASSVSPPPSSSSVAPVNIPGNIQSTTIEFVTITIAAPTSTPSPTTIKTPRVVVVTMTITVPDETPTSTSLTPSQTLSGTVGNGRTTTASPTFTPLGTLAPSPFLSNVRGPPSVSGSSTVPSQTPIRRRTYVHRSWRAPAYL